MFRRNGQGKRQDAKSRTMGRLAMLDEDISSRYDFDNDDDEGRFVRGRRQQKKPTDPGRLLREAIQQRNEKLALRVAGGQQRNKKIVYQVTIRGIGKEKLNKEYVLKALCDAVDDFKPIAPSMEGPNLVFFLIEKEVADAVKSMSRRITERNRPSVKYIIVTRTTVAPWEFINLKVKQAIDEALDNRYSVLENAVNLSEFFSDRAFTTKGVRPQLFQNGVMIRVAEAIREKYPSITSLSLKGNRLRSLDFASSLVFRAPDVRILDLSSNNLTRIEELEKLRGWPVESLYLENNELCKKFSDAQAYISAVHEYFPMVTNLDGHIVRANQAKMNELDQLKTVELPPIRPGFSRDEGTRALVEKFLTEYFSLYDGKDTKTRESLLSAYQEEATFTFTISTLKGQPLRRPAEEEAYKQYLRSSHNLLHEEKWAKYREKIVYRGSMDIAVQLKSMPPTEHIADSFVLDFTLCTEHLMAFTLQGLFRDGSDAFKKNGSVKFFVRNFVVVPTGPGKMVILSDLLSITPVHVDRMVAYKALLKKAQDTIAQPGPPAATAQQPAPLPLEAQMAVMGGAAQPPAPATTAQQLPPSTTQPTAYDRNDPAIQAAMVEQFAKQSGMKPEWARKCLEDQAWDYEGAGQKFLEVRDRIPPEAFE